MTQPTILHTIIRGFAGAALAATIVITPLSASATDSPFPIPQAAQALGQDLGTAVALPFELTQDSLGLTEAVIETVSEILPNPEMPQ